MVVPACATSKGRIARGLPAQPTQAGRSATSFRRGKLAPRSIGPCSQSGLVAAFCRSRTSSAISGMFSDCSAAAQEFKSTVGPVDFNRRIWTELALKYRPSKASAAATAGPDPINGAFRSRLRASIVSEWTESFRFMTLNSLGGPRLLAVLSILGFIERFPQDVL